MSSPQAATSIPIPTIPFAIRQLLRLRLPPIYTPPGMAAHGAMSVGDMVSGVAGRNGGRLPIPIVNPLGPMAYAWRIADAALRADERAEGIKRGIMNEPVGPGVRWDARNNAELSLCFSLSGILPAFRWLWHICKPNLSY